MRKLLPFLTGLLLVFGLPARAQDSAPLVAALTEGDVWLYDFAAGAQAITGTLTPYSVANPAWSPDGSLLAFVGLTPDESVAAYLSDSTGRTPVAIATGIHPAFPVTFSPDSTEVVYALPGSDFSLVQVYRYAAEAGAAAVQLGSFNYTFDCPTSGAPRLPTDARLAYTERNNTWSGYPALLALTPWGLLHTSRCSALDVWQLNPRNQEDILLFERVDGVFVSPEQARVVITDDNLVTFVNSERGPYTQLTLVATPDQVGFGLPDSGEIFYSTREAVDPTPLPDDVRARLENIFFQLPMNYRVSLRRFSLRTGRDEVLYTADAYGISRIALTPDGGSLLFSQVPNADAWVDAIAAGRVEPTDAQANYDALTTEIYRLSLADNTVERVGVDWLQMALNPALDPVGPTAPLAAPPTWTPVPTATLPPTFTPPPPDAETAPTLSASGLAPGLEVVVNEGFTALNVRRQPGTGTAVVAVIYAGDPATIIEGPAEAEGFLWWHIRLASGADGWVVENVGGVQTLVP